MDVILFVIMLIIPSVFALSIHSYLRHGDISLKKKVILFIGYAFVLNVICYIVSWLRGVTGFNYRNMTFTYKMKYLGLGCVFGFVIPFVGCLVTENIITIAGYIRYASRLFRDLKRFLPYAIWAAKADLGAEIASSYLNWMWWLIEPFCMMLIYTAMFTYVFKATEDYFPVFIFLGLTMWNFFARSITHSVNIIRANKDIITKIYMPKYILLLSKMFVNGFKMLVSFGIIAGMMLFYHVPLSIYVIWGIPILIILFMFTFGVGTIMMHYGVYVNDLGYITGIVLQMMMYMTGIFYSVAKRIPEPLGEIMQEYNPVACIIDSMRLSLIYSSEPPIKLLSIWALISLVLIALGIFTIYSNENAYVKVI